jgi:beta-mannosidase
MFVGHRINCKERLAQGLNTLRIHFYSPVAKGLAKQAKSGHIIPAPNEKAPENKQSSIYTRKAPFHYGWDWGPRLVTSGIWRPVYVEAWNHAAINDVYVVTKTIDKCLATMNAWVDVEILNTGNYVLSLLINGEDIGIRKATGLNTGKHCLEIEFALEKPRLWWPNGLGEPWLYDFEFSLRREDTIISKKDMKTGVRTVKLVQKPDISGHTFYFEVNGIPAFMKGANVIPSETLTPAVTVDRYRKLFASAKSANMNMLRVWGGAIYEEDLFYQLCDENGLLVWQDFMFACAMQPGDQPHLESIQREAEYNVKRLRNHACLALWCGNNEIMYGWHKWEWQDGLDNKITQQLWETYEKIFHNILPAAVRQHDPKNSYWPSTPATINNNLPDRKSGDEHDWTVCFGQKPIDSYWENVPRFVTEWGLQAFPSMLTIRTFANDDELMLDSAVIRHRQRSKLDWLQLGFDGNDLIKWYVEQYHDAPEQFEHFVYLSQGLQAEAYKTAIEAHRSAMPHCMGSLFWQLNDCWPTISWSTIDYFSRWKAAQYAVQKAFMPVIVTVKRTNSSVMVYVVSDKINAFDATLQVRLIDFSGNTIFESVKEVEVSPNTATLLLEKDLSSLLPKDKAGDKVFDIRLLTGDKQIADNMLFFVKPKDLQLARPDLQYCLRRTDKKYLVSLESDTLVRHLCIETPDPDARFSDNFFDLLPNQQKNVVIKSSLPGLQKKDVVFKYLNS